MRLSTVVLSIILAAMTANAQQAQKPPDQTAALYHYPGYGIIIAASGRTKYLDGKNSIRATNQIVHYSVDFYSKTSPSNAGVDILIAGGKVQEIRDRAKAVFLDKKEDPGPVGVADATAVVISGNGEGRKWLIENLKTGDEIILTGIERGTEIPPMKKLPCFDGAHYRKVVSSFDAWTGIAGFVKLGTPKIDEARIGESTKQPLDNFSVYMGANAGGKFEVDAGLSWEFTVDESGKKSERRNAFRPFWRAQDGGWNSAPTRNEFYFYPGETLQMAVLAAGPKKLRLIISDGKTKTFQTDFDAEGLVAGVPRQFKRVNAIDQVGNEGRPTLATKAEITGSEWLQTVLLRGEGAAAQQLPMNASRFTDMRCSNGAIAVTATDAAKGGEKIDIFGRPKN